MAAKEFVEDLLNAGLKDRNFSEFYARGRLRRALASSLVRIRKAVGLTQSALGDKVGWKQPYVARLERGDSDALAAMERVGRFAAACGVSTVLIFADKETGKVTSGVAISDDERAQELVKRIEGEFVSSPARINEAMVALESTLAEVAKQAARVRSVIEVQVNRSRSS